MARPHSSDNSYGVLTRGTGVFTTTLKNAEVPFSPITVSSGQAMGDTVIFSLSNGSSIYAGNKMQSAALSALPCIRT